MRHLTERHLWAAIAGFCAGVLLTDCRNARAQATSETTTITVGAGTWYMAVRARSAAGLNSGWSNELMTRCTPVAPATTCDLRLLWDPPLGGEPVAIYDLQWGTVPGTYVQAKLVTPTLGNPGRLPAPSLRIRRAE